MEDLFKTKISVNNEPLSYRVVFEEEQYRFTAEAGNSPFSSFGLKRENDEWHEQESLPPEIKKQAVDALEKYLLQQH